MFYNNKAIGPVIASGLLLVVAIVSVVTFQTWFNSYSSNIFSDVETQSSDSVSSSNIDSIIDGNLYFKNSGTQNITISSIKVGSVDCNVSQSITPGVSSIDVSSCVNGTSGSNEVVVITNQKVFSKKLYLTNQITSSSTNSNNSISLSFSTNTSYIINGSSINLSWISGEVNNCVATGDWSGSKNLNDSEIITPNSNSTYNLNCSSLDSYLIKSVNIVVLPIETMLNLDLYWENVVLYISSEGVDGSTSFIDSSNFGNEVLNFGDIHHETNNSYFGTSSIYLDGTQDFLTIPYSSDISLGDEDFTIEFWANLDTIQQSQSTVRIRNTFLSVGSGYVNSNSWDLMYARCGTTDDYLIVYQDGEGSSCSLVSNAGVISEDEWYHIAFTRQGSIGYLFLNGTLIDNATINTNFNVTEDLLIGTHKTYYNRTDNRDLNAYLEEIRITKGVAKYNESFTVPTGPLVNSLIEVSLSSNVSFIRNLGDNLELVWSSNNSDSCVATGDWSGTKNSSGSQIIQNNNSRQTFNLTCSSGIGTNDISLDMNLVQVNCKDFYDLGFTSNGQYYIDPDGIGGEDPFQTYCNMDFSVTPLTLVGRYTDASDSYGQEISLDITSENEYMSQSIYSLLRNISNYYIFYKEGEDKYYNLSKVELASFNPNCQDMTNLTPYIRSGDFFFAYTDPGCNGVGSDYSFITLRGGTGTVDTRSSGPDYIYNQTGPTNWTLDTVTRVETGPLSIYLAE